MASNEPPITTIPPFADAAALPSCAVECTELYGANGGCVPPAIPEADPTVYTSCFCANPSVAGFSSAATGVCDYACAGDDTGLTSIQNWFQSICSANDGGDGGDDNNGGPSNPASSSTVGGGSSSGGSGGSNNNNENGDWLSNHWQWVIMIVVLVVGIAAIWIGAAIWRRRYLKKKDRQTSMNQKSSGSANRPSWGPGVASSGPNVGVMSSSGAPGSFMPGSGEPKEKKKWTVRGRT